MSTSILFISCSQYDELFTNENNSNNVFSKSLNYSGEDIFKGIFFAKGEVANLLTNINNSHSYYLINNLSNAESIQYELEIESVINEIRTKNSSFFDDFKNQIESGSHVLINETISEGAKKIFEAYVDKYIANSEKENFLSAIDQINLDNYISEIGEVDYDRLLDDLMDNEALQPNFVGPHFIGVVFVVAAYVLVVHAAAAMTYVGIAWVAQYYAALDRDKTVTRSAVIKKSIKSEMLVNEISQKLVR